MSTLPRLSSRLRQTLLLASMILTVTRPAQAQTEREPVAHEAIPFVLERFDTYSVVGLGEWHGLQALHDLYIALVQHPDFPAQVDDIVVEYGNTRFQDLLDRYVGGEDVPRHELRKVWRDLSVSTFLQHGADQFEDFFAAVRQVNQRLSPEQRIRVLCGGPPIDWSQVQRRDEVAAFLEQRDPHYAKVVVDEVLARGRKALIIAGGMHFKRHNVPALIEQHHPGSTYIIQFLPGFGPREVELLPRLVDWRLPAVADVRDTWMGSLDMPSIAVEAADVSLRSIPPNAPLQDGEIIVSEPMPGMKQIERVVNGQAVTLGVVGSPTGGPPDAVWVDGPLPDSLQALPDDSVAAGGVALPEGNRSDRVHPSEGPSDAVVAGANPIAPYANLPPGRYMRVVLDEGKTLKDLTDAVLYVGPIGTLASVPVPEELWEDDAFWEELDRRHRIHPGGPLDPVIRASKGQEDRH